MWLGIEGFGKVLAEAPRPARRPKDLEFVVKSLFFIVSFNSTNAEGVEELKTVNSINSTTLKTHS